MLTPPLPHRLMKRTVKESNVTPLSPADEVVVPDFNTVRGKKRACHREHRRQPLSEGSACNIDALSSRIHKTCLMHIQALS
jgi:hypothetical protein